jgi:hypothetical protein
MEMVATMAKQKVDAQTQAHEGNPGGKSGGKRAPKTKTIRVAAELADMIRFVAGRRNQDTSDAVDHLLRQWAMTEYAVESAKLVNRPRNDRD